MNDLDPQSPMVSSRVIKNSQSPTLLFYCFHFISSESYEIVLIVADSEIQHQGFCSC